MQPQLRLMILAGAICAWVPAAGAADLRSADMVAAPDAPRMRVVIDDLFVRYWRCRTDPDCVAPRILPIVRGRQLTDPVEIVIPVDPRFARDYSR